MGLRQLRGALLEVLFFAFLPIYALALPPEEVAALREIYLAAHIPWEQIQDPCKTQLKGLNVTCYNDHVIYLTLNNRNVTSLPESIGQLQELSYLSFRYNRLASLPESISQLHKLSELYLAYNLLTSLPESIGQLRGLGLLEIAANRLASLPDSIGQLQELFTLELQGNLLTSLPESIGQLQALGNLYLDHNQLMLLPESVGQLQRLGLLYLQSNRLTSLPNSIGQLQVLQALALNDNQLASLPGSIGHLHKLHSFQLQGNLLTSLPESIGQLQVLVSLNLDDNRLTSLPESIWQLQKLEVLLLDGNRLACLPEVIGQLSLQHLSAARNRLVSLPESLGSATSLRVINMHSNLLTHFPASLANLSNLTVVDFHSNQLCDVLELCKLQNNANLSNLFLHDNALQGNIPLCLKKFSSLEVLTLHGNALTGSIPGAFGAFGLPQNMTLLTLHRNRLSGVIPEDFAQLPRLSFLSAYSNDLKGSIPPLRLKNDCVDDLSFQHYNDPYVVICGFEIPGFMSVADFCKIPDVQKYCPKSCGLCNVTSSRGPVLLVQKNRLSCKLPSEVTMWPEEMRSISLIGNRLGDGSPMLPSWISTAEHQPFLYFSSNETIEIFKKTMLYATLLVAMLLLLVKAGCPWTCSKAAPLTHEAHRFLFQMSISLSAVGVALLILYRRFATYYLCSDGFFSSTLSNFSKPDDAIAEWGFVIAWAVWILVAAFFLRRAPNPRPAGEVRSNLGFRDFLQKVIYGFLWLCIVTILSFPSVFYAISDSMPSNNTLGVTPRWKSVLHYQAALIMVLVDMFLTPKAVAIFSAFSGVRRTMLLIAARLVTMWLAASLTTLFLSPHCMNGWTLTWKVCDERTAEYEALNITFGDTQILEPKADLCEASMSWWSDGRCMRSLVDTMAPLLLSKMITRALFQPVITLVKWQVSHHRDGQLYLRRYLLFGNPTRFCTSNSLEQGQQASLLVTFAEMALLWGPFVPVLLPAVVLATATNMLVCQIGHGHYAVEHRTFDINPIGISRRYLYGTLSVTLLFQNWFAWTSEMHGKWLLLITAGICVLEVVASVITGRNVNRSSETNLEMRSMSWMNQQPLALEHLYTSPPSWTAPRVG